MASAGTFLDDLAKEGGGSAGDNDLVQEIFNTLNEPSQANPIYGQGAAPPPPMGVRAPMMNAQQQLPNTLPNTADPAIPTAHMIGRDHPTNADFQQAILQSTGPVAFNSMDPGSTLGQSVQSMMLPPPNHAVYQEPKKNWQGTILTEMKQPVLVALIVFIVTLPALNLLVSHYAPKLMKSTGEFTALGMVLRAVIAGGLFWFFQNVVGPLVSF